MIQSRIAFSAVAFAVLGLTTGIPAASPAYADTVIREHDQPKRVTAPPKVRDHRTYPCRAQVCAKPKWQP